VIGGLEWEPETEWGRVWEWIQILVGGAGDGNGRGWCW